MFQIKLHLDNPFSSKETFDNLFSRCYKVSKNKFFEFEVTYHSIMIFDFDFQYSTKRDHGGLDLSIGAFKRTLSFRLLDYRHWDYKNNRWEKNES